jgi:CheY-like chemotaxis protein
MIKNKYAILLVDDSVDDRLFMRKAVERSEKLAVAGEVTDGQEAIDYLRGEQPFQDRTAYPWPDAVFLDLKMPRKNGFDVLQWIRSESLKNLAVVVISGSWLDEDVSRSLALGADGYFKKTSVRQEQEEMVRSIEELLGRLLFPAS